MLWPKPTFAATFHFSSFVSPRYTSMAGHVVLAIASLLLAGCGESKSNPPDQTTATAVSDPGSEFEWAMERLEHILDTTRPSTADGLYTDRKMKYQVSPPSGSQQLYTATVTITTESEFIHGKRKAEKKEDEKADSTEEPTYKDPREDPSDEIAKLIDIPGIGPKAPVATAPSIEPRSLENEAIFELTYLDEEWRLNAEPEEDLEKMWFDYAFQRR